LKNSFDAVQSMFTAPEL